MFGNNPQGHYNGDPRIGAGHVNRYLGSSFDVVYAVYKQLPNFTPILNFIEHQIPRIVEVEKQNAEIFEKHIQITQFRDDTLEARDNANQTLLETQEVLRQTQAIYISTQEVYAETGTTLQALLESTQEVFTNTQEVFDQVQLARTEVNEAADQISQYTTEVLQAADRIEDLITSTEYAIVKADRIFNEWLLENPGGTWEQFMTEHGSGAFWDMKEW